MTETIGGLRPRRGTGIALANAWREAKKCPLSVGLMPLRCRGKPSLLGRAEPLTRFAVSVPAARGKLPLSRNAWLSGISALPHSVPVAVFAQGS